jgi:hypothetical protein
VTASNDTAHITSPTIAADVLAPWRRAQGERAG